MNIALMTDGNSMSSVVSDVFESAEYLNIYNYEDSKIIATYALKEYPIIEIAKKIIEHDCEAVICGPIEEEPFIIIADEGCVTRFMGASLKADDAIRLMQEYKLDIIPDFIGGTGCNSGKEENCLMHTDHEDD